MKQHFDNPKAIFGATENAGRGQCRTWKMTDQIAAKNAKPVTGYTARRSGLTLWQTDFLSTSNVCVRPIA